MVVWLVFGVALTIAFFISVLLWWVSDLANQVKWTWLLVHPLRVLSIIGFLAWGDTLLWWLAVPIVWMFGRIKR